LLLIFLWNPSLYSQSKSDETIAWVSLEQALKMNPEEVLHLKLKANKKRIVPLEIFQFTNLESLSLRGMKLTVLPENMGVFKHLSYLDISKNKIEDLPLSICELSKIQIFIANNSPLGYLPYCFGNLNRLEKLDVWSTEISTLPESMEENDNLKKVDWRGVQLQQEEQDLLKKRFPEVQFFFDRPCNCFK
jgi:Leucine-rich repeat (LRR) protein